MSNRSVTDGTDSQQKASGAFTWALTMMVWYILLVQLLDAVDFPITPPLGDLSHIIKGKSEKAAQKKREHSD